MITFFDLPVNNAIRTGSVHAWKARYCLNYKGIPYKTRWVEYVDIEPVYKELGIPPSSTKPDGTPFYTIPAIIDDATGAKISDSIKIAEYLDGTYLSDKMDIVPVGTKVLHLAFIDAFMDAMGPIYPLFVPPIPKLFNPPSAVYFSQTRAQAVGVKHLDDLLPVGDEARALTFKKAEDSFGKIHGWLKPAGDKPFIGGDTPIFADFVIGSALLSMKYTWGEDSDEWKILGSWHGGRWEKIVDDLKMYQYVD